MKSSPIQSNRRSTPSKLTLIDMRICMHSAQVYGEPVDAVVLIPHMLSAFMEQDRGFKESQLEEKRVTT